MTLIEIYADLIRRGVRCFSGDYGLDAGADAVTVKLGDNFGVFLDDRRIRTTAQEKVAASHEWAHIVEDATYGVDAPKELVKIAERRADFRQISEILPWCVIAPYLRQGLSVYEISERENVTEDFVRRAIRYWTEKRGKTA